MSGPNRMVTDTHGRHVHVAGHENGWVVLGDEHTTHTLTVAQAKKLLGDLLEALLVATDGGGEPDA